MASLPPGWEWDYDGTRWFYKYKPNGHIQYHFPSEGDEFPDFIADGAPAPDLAPEERLESQQQMKRQTSTSPGTRGRAGNGNSSNNNGGLKPRMSAAARPVSAMWEEETEEDGVFQPENFMFLGPGTYTDVSPLAEEEEEAAKKAVAGGIGGRVEGKTGVSPLASERNTPQVLTSEPVTSSSPRAMQEQQQQHQQEEEEVVHMLDSREMPHELPVEEPLRRFDPVGLMAEMATAETAASRAETHPDPVEMADTSVRAPVEMEVPKWIAELPEDNGAAKKDEQEAKTEKEAGKNEGEAKELVKETAAAGAVQPLKIEKRPKRGESPPTGGYQPYAPSKATDALSRSSTPARDDGTRTNRTSLQREASLMMGSKSQSSSAVDHPAVLSPPRIQAKASPENKASKTNVKDAPAEIMVDSGVIVQGADVQEQGASPPELSHVPSVLKPARNGNTQTAGASSQAPTQAPEKKQQEPGVNKFPSVLKPARRRAPSQPSQPPQQQQQQQQQPIQPGGFVPLPAGVHPPSMTPALDIRPGIQRVSTVPEQSTQQGSFLPYQKPDAAAILAQQQPRPASVMPAIGYSQHQPFGQTYQPGQTRGQTDTGGSSQGTSFPYAGRTEELPSTAPPPSGKAWPFATPGTDPSIQFKPALHTDLVGQSYVATSGSQSPATYANPSQQKVSPEDHPYGDVTRPSPPLQQNRRHSSFAAMDVSPLTSKHGSISSPFPLQTPSTMDQTRRDSSSASLAHAANYTPSPVSQGSRSLGPSPTPPSAASPGPPVPDKFPTSDGGSYFPSQATEGQGHAVAAQAQLRRTSVARAHDVSKRNSMPTEQLMSMMQRNPFVQTAQAAEQAQRSSQGPQSPIEGDVPIPSHLLSRIEEHEESAAPPGRKSTSTQDTAQHTIASSQTSLQAQKQYGPSVPSKVPPSAPPEGQGVVSQEKVDQQQQSQTPDRKSIQGQMQPYQGQVPSIQVPPQNQVQSQATIAKTYSPIQGQPHFQGLPQGQARRQSLPGQPVPSGQFTQKQVNEPLNGQNMPRQLHPPVKDPQQGQTPPQRQAIQVQPQAYPQGQAPLGPQPYGQLPQGRMSMPAQARPQAQMVPGQTPPQGSSTYGQQPPGQVPMSPQGQNPPRHPFQGQAPPGQVLLQGQPPFKRITTGHLPLDPMPPGVAPGQVAPQGAAPLQMPQGQPLYGQRPAGQQIWHPNIPTSPSQGFRPSSVPPQGTQSHGHKEKEKKWLKWLKSGSKSISYTPAPQQQVMVPAAIPPPGQQSQPAPSWGGGEYSKPAVWQPGQPVKTQPPPGPQTTPQNSSTQAVQTVATVAGTTTGPTPIGPQAPGIAQVPTVIAPQVSEAVIPRRRDSASDTASISTTIEVAEAKSQPVLRPQMVHVRRKSQDSERSQSSAPHPGPLSSHPPNQGPFVSSHTRTSSTATITAQQHIGPQHQSETDCTLTPAPLFSGQNSPVSVKSKRQSQQWNNTEVAVNADETTGKPRVEDKWAKKPAADYSGGGWGDDDSWH